MKKKKKKELDVLTEISASFPVDDLPKTAADMVNNYGTYEIQNTANTDNQYPAIAQGYNKKIAKNDCENRQDTGI